MKNVRWLEVLLVMATLSEVKMDDLGCGTTARLDCTCGDLHSMRDSTFYQLRGRSVTLVLNAPYRNGTIDLWYTKEFWYLKSLSTTWQVQRSKRNVTIKYMDDNLDGTIFRYYQENYYGRTMYQTSATAHVGINASLPFGNRRLVIDIKPGQQPQTISFNVTGKPTPKVYVTKSWLLLMFGFLQDGTNFTLKDGIVRFTPVKEFVTYYVTVKNCFNSVTGRLFINLLSNATTDTYGGLVTAVCGTPVSLACNGSGNPLPNITWIYPKTSSCQKDRNDSQTAIFFKFDNCCSTFI
jgi:hypothetical protein